MSLPGAHVTELQADTFRHRSASQSCPKISPQIMKKGWWDKESSGLRGSWHRLGDCRPVQFTGDAQPRSQHGPCSASTSSAHLQKAAGETWSLPWRPWLLQQQAAATVQERTSASAGDPLGAFHHPLSGSCCALKKSLEVFPFLTDANVASRVYQNRTARNHSAKASGYLLTASSGEGGIRRPE